MKRFFFVSLLVFTLLIVVLSFCKSPHSINDNYCDCLDGSDEENSPACSHLQKPRRFLCAGSDFLNISIPFSRIGDGVCDCCDGSDENDSPFRINCPNHCDEELSFIRQNALIDFRIVNSGNEARQVLVESLRRARLREKNIYEDMQKDVSWIQELVFFLRTNLILDQNYESKQHFK